LIDKGAVPNWTYKSVLEVPESEITNYFTFAQDFETLDI